jgi:C4-dicarboxylate-specific signal transduction histidine kinase
MSPQPAGPVRRFTASRYLAPVLSIVAVGVLVTTLVAYFYTRATVENLAQGQITQALSFLDREITMQTRDMVMQTNLMAQEDVLRLALEDSYLGRSARVAAQRKLDAYVRNGAFDRAYLMNLRGRLVLASDQTLTEHLIISDRRYFTQAAAGHHVLETLTVSRVTGRPTLVSSTPLRDPGGSVIGVVVGLISIDAFAREMLNDSRIGQSGGAYLMNRDGAVLGTPGWAAPGAFGVRAANGQAASHAQQLLANARQGGVFRFTRNGARRMCISRLNETTQWVLVLEADEDEVLAPATRLAAVSGAISLVTLLTVFLALGALRRLLPICAAPRPTTAPSPNSRRGHRHLRGVWKTGVPEPAGQDHPGHPAGRAAAQDHRPGGRRGAAPGRPELALCPSPAGPRLHRGAAGLAAERDR